MGASFTLALFGERRCRAEWAPLLGWALAQACARSDSQHRSDSLTPVSAGCAGHAAEDTFVARHRHFLKSISTFFIHSLRRPRSCGHIRGEPPLAAPAPGVCGRQGERRRFGTRLPLRACCCVPAAVCLLLAADGGITAGAHPCGLATQPPHATPLPAVALIICCSAPRKLFTAPQNLVLFEGDHNSSESGCSWGGGQTGSSQALAAASSAAPTWAARMRMCPAARGFRKQPPSFPLMIVSIGSSAGPLVHLGHGLPGEGTGGPGRLLGRAAAVRERRLPGAGRTRGGRRRRPRHPLPSSSPI